MRAQIEITHEPKTAWKLINEQLRGKQCLRRLPENLSKEVIAKQDLNLANEYFIGVGEQVNKQIGYEETMDDLLSYEVKENITEFSKPTENQIESITKVLKTGRAPEPDGFTALTMKNNSELFGPIVTHLTSLVCTTGTSLACLVNTMKTPVFR